MDSYVIRIYRRRKAAADDSDPPVLGVVEHPIDKTTRSFSDREELWELLQVANELPTKKDQNEPS